MRLGKREMQTRFILVRPLEIFHYLCKYPFYNFWTTKESLSLVFRKLTIQEITVSWLQLTFWEEQKDFSPLEWIIQFEVPGWTINRFASFCPRVVERAFANEVLLEYLFLFEIRHTYIGPSCLFKMVRRDVSFQKAFSKFFHG